MSDDCGLRIRLANLCAVRWMQPRMVEDRAAAEQASAGIDHVADLVGDVGRLRAEKSGSSTVRRATDAASDGGPRCRSGAVLRQIDRVTNLVANVG